MLKNWDFLLKGNGNLLGGCKGVKSHMFSKGHPGNWRLYLVS
jgi:hypothetical protein